MPDDDEKSGGMSAGKWALMALGGLVAVGVVVSVLKPLIILGAIGGAGYFGYRWMTKKKAIGGGAKKSLPGASDYDAKMRKLDALSRKLDRDVGD